MIYHPTQSDDYLWYLILLRKRNEKKTGIVGYCANSTECSDHSLRKIQKKTFFKLVFFLHGVIKRSEQKKKI